MTERAEYNEIFEGAIQYPDPEYNERLNNLVGLDEHKTRVMKLLSLLINPSGIEKWAKKYYKKAPTVVNYVLKRPPLIIFEGDVGSGKSELALTIGDAVSRVEGLDIMLLPLSLSTRGEGRVGQMTKLISDAFDLTIDRAKNLKNSSNKAKGGVILLVDEADSLTQSRESSQMHHEDRAGVNAFIRGIDRLGNGKLPAAVILCTNRVNSLDPAVKRRSADILSFGRPNETQREAVLKGPLKELGLSRVAIEKIVKATGPKDSIKYGFTYSDLTQRVLPAIILDAYPDQKVTAERAFNIVNQMGATPPFNGMFYA